MRTVFAVSFGCAFFVAVLLGFAALYGYSVSESAIHEGVVTIVVVGFLVAWLIGVVSFAVLAMVGAVRKELAIVREENRRICKALMAKGNDVCASIESLRAGKKSAA